MNSVLLGTILAALIGAWIALYIRRKNINKETTDRFIKVFTDFIQRLETKGALFPGMDEMNRQHKRAAIELRNSLIWWDAIKFNRYWKQYRKKADKYYNAPAQLGFPATNKEMLNAIRKLIKKVKRI